MALFKTLLIIVLCFLPQMAWSWGFMAHRASAFIAEANLSAPAKEALREILGDVSFVEASVWADSVRRTSQYYQTQSYHFGNIPESFPEGQSLSAKKILQAPDRQPGILEAILKSKQILETSTSTKKQKENAVKFLIHFIADLHQPLHAGYKKDRGGNSVKFVWFGKETNLHTVWDSEIILRSKAPLLKGLEKEEVALAYAKEISESHPSPFQGAGKDFGTMGDWYQESLDMVSSTYEGFEEDPQGYLDRNEQLVDIRVRLAGLRIAETLNQIFGSQKDRLAGNLGKQELKKLFGDIDNIIQLGPRAPKKI